jgi:ankyrin repeat protein
MNRLLLLEKKLDRIENTLLRKFEAKQVGTLYHVCTLDSYLKYILPHDQLAASGKYQNWIHNSDKYVSFTRSGTFVLDSRDDDTVLVQLVVDGDKLSENYKIGPYNDFGFDEDGNLKDYDDPKRREMEEAVKGPIKNISKYIKEIRFDIAACHDLTKEKDLVTLKKNADKLQNLVYYKFLKTRSANIGCESGTSFNIAMSVLDEWKSQESIQEMLFSYSISKIKKAIEAGADVNKKSDADGYPLVYYSEDDDSVPIVRVLLKAGANPNITHNEMPLLCYAIDNWCNNIASVLIRANADVNATDNKGMNALMHAVDAGINDDVTKRIIKAGANIDAQDKNGNTALMIAVKNGDYDTVKLLVKLGADTNITNKNGDTAISLSSNKKISSLLKSAASIDSANMPV